MPKYIKDSKQVTESIGLMFPKSMGTKKKRDKDKPKSRPSILQQKDGRCYLCMQEGIWVKHSVIHEHHIYGGPMRPISEANGFKVYLCLEHHLTGQAAVHRDDAVSEMLQGDCQRAFLGSHTMEEWMAIMGRNYLEESEEKGWND